MFPQMLFKNSTICNSIYLLKSFVIKCRNEIEMKLFINVEFMHKKHVLLISPGRLGRATRVLHQQSLGANGRDVIRTWMWVATETGCLQQSVAFCRLDST